MAAQTAQTARISSKADRDYAELVSLLGEEGVQHLNTSQRSALAQQGIPVPATTPMTPSGTSVTAANDTDAELEELSAETTRLGQTRNQRRAADRLRKEAPESDQAIRQGAADQAQELRGLALRQANEAQQGLRERVNTFADRVGSFQTPGGLGMLFLVLALLLLVLIPVKGQPRLVWLWLVLVRKARLMRESDAKTGTAPTTPTTPSVTASNGNTAAVVASGGLAGLGVTLPGLPSEILSLPNALDRYIHP